MRLYFKVLLAALIPIFLLTAQSLWQVGRIVDAQNDSVERSYQLEGRLVAARAQELAHDLNTQADILSRTREVAIAARNADVDSLYFLGANFLGANISRIVFTDIDGTVLARAHDEHNFGDSYAGKKSFLEAIRSGSFLGVERCEGQLCLIASKLVKLYGEIPTGTVILAVEITPALLSRLAEGTASAMTFRYEGQTVSPAGLSGSFIRDVPVSMPFGSDIPPGSGFLVRLHADKGHEELLAYQRTMRLITGLMAVLLPLLVLVILRRHLRPYDSVVAALSRYGDGRLDLKDLQAWVEPLVSNRNHEMSRVARALMRMTETVERTFSMLQAQNQRLDILSRTDKLTQVPNRLHIDSRLSQDVARARRYSLPMSVIMIDIDHFKEINDRHGHAAGDEVLVNFARLVQENTREADVVGRWGGEEFLVILPNTDIEGAMRYAEKIRTACQLREFPHGGRVTCSIGCAMLRENDTREDLVVLADTALYQAKQRGRNRCESAPI